MPTSKLRITLLLCAAAGLAQADSWSGWNSLGGGIYGSPSAIMNVDGRLEIFAVGGGNAIYHNWQTSPSGGWSGWTWMGGSIQQPPVPVINADGRVELFGWGTDGALWHAWQQTAANSSSWTGWSSLGGGIYANPAVAVNSDGRLEAVVVGSYGEVYHIWQTSAGGGWTGYTWMGAAMAPTTSLAIGTNLDGRLEVFARGTDNNLYHAWEQTAANSSSYTGWGTLSAPSGGVGGAPSVASNYDGRLDVFVVNPSEAPYHIAQTSAGGGWGGWTGLGGAIITPTVTQNMDGRLELFGIGGGNAVYHNWQTTPGGSFSGWSSLGGVIMANNVGVAMNANGTLEIFGEWQTAAGYHNWQTTAGANDVPTPNPTPVTPPTLPVPPGSTVGSLGYALLEDVEETLNPITVYAPSSTNQAYAYCYNPSNELDLIPCNLGIATWAYESTNGHFHTNPPPPVSDFSPEAGYTGDYSDLQIPVTIYTTPVGQIESINVEDEDNGLTTYYDYAVGYNTFTYVSGGNFVQVGGNTTNHGDNTWNHWMTPGALSGLSAAATSYLNNYNRGHSICINDMSLPIGGVFDIHDNWTSPHLSHDKGTAADISTVAGQCSAANIVSPGPFMKACQTAGAVDWRVEVPPHVHCRWPN